MFVDLLQSCARMQLRIVVLILWMLIIVVRFAGMCKEQIQLCCMACLMRPLQPLQTEALSQCY